MEIGCNDLKVSIITVCYNSAKTIRDTIESVAKQDYPDIEYIIVDGDSQDSTKSILRDCSKYIDKQISEQDNGIYDAMNKGLELATGDVIGFLNSDDLYSDTNVISDLMKHLVSAGADAIFADLVLVEQDNLQKVVRRYDSSRFHVGRFRFGWMPAHPTFFIKRSFYERVGPFSLDYKIAGDFEMMVRLLYKESAQFVYFPKEVVKMRAGGISTLGWRQSLRINREIVRACRSNGIWTALPVLLLKLPAKLLEVLKGRLRA